MKKQFILGILGLVLAGSAFAQNSVVTCKSIDPTHRPFYDVEIRKFDPSFPNYFALKVNKTLSSGQVEKTVTEGRGEMVENGYFIEFIDNRGQIEGQVLANGIVNAEMDLDDAKGVELVCKLPDFT